MTSYNRKYRSLACGLVAGLAASAALAGTAEAAGSTSFALARSTGLPPTCAPNAKASVKIQKQGFAEKLTVTVSGLPAGTELDLFTLQVPNVPFGLGWYVGDLEVGSKGTVSKSFVAASASRPSPWPSSAPHPRPPPIRATPA